METLSFTLGVLAVIDILLVAGTFLVLKTMNIIRKQSENTQRNLQYEIERLERDIIQMNNDLSYNINRSEEQSIRHTDSRVDKLEAKIYNDFDIKKNQRRQYM